MKSGASNRRSIPRPERRAKKATNPTKLRPEPAASTGPEAALNTSAPCDIVQPDLQARESTAIGWAYAEPPLLSGRRLGAGVTEYRVVIDCVFDRRKHGTAE